MARRLDFDEGSTSACPSERASRDSFCYHGNFWLGLGYAALDTADCSGADTVDVHNQDALTADSRLLKLLRILLRTIG